MRFKGKVVLVSGGGLNIGREAALAFAREGASVMVGDLDAIGGRDTLAELQELTDRCAWVRTDIRSEADIVRMRDATLRRFGRIDVLLNNAAVGSTAPPLAQITAADWDFAFAGNVRQMFLTTRHVIPEMVKAGGGAIVNVSTVQAFLSANALAYGPSKAGIMNLTRHIALYYGRHGIRANCVCPGHTVTPRNRAAYESDPNLLPKYPIGRLGRMEDIVNAYLYLASDESAFVTGATLMVDGGYSAH